MTAPILVTGGTGTLGRHVVSRLRSAGVEVRVLSRSHREKREDEAGLSFVAGDLATGTGIDAAVDGVDVVVHLAGSAKGDEEKARHLVRAATGSGVRHLVYMSVVGADRIPMVSGVDRAIFGYFGAKLAAEEIVAESGIPWTTLRSTQFHDLVLQTAQQMSKMPVVMAPSGFQFQPIDADEVAARLVELALGTPAGLVPEMGGPQAYAMSDLLRGYLRASGKYRPILPVRLPGRAARAVRAGANLVPERAVGRKRWEDFLTERLGTMGDNATVPGVVPLSPRPVVDERLE